MYPLFYVAFVSVNQSIACVYWS